MVYATDGVSNLEGLFHILGGKPDKPKFCRFCNSNDFIGDFITHHGPQLGESKYKGYIEAPERLYITFF